MGEWKKIPISSFLTERAGRYKPEDLAVTELMRLEKIDFDGNIHLSDKTSKTDMIIIQPGDLVISGINVAKGAIAVYEGDVPITATIHYSSYTFNDAIIDIDFFKRFLKSPTFIHALQRQVKGGIKTEIKPKSLLPIVISIPDIKEQRLINKHFESFEDELLELTSESGKQEDYLKQLRQSILQEAIEGKLTAEWRKAHPVINGNPDYDAEALLEAVKKEKAKLIAEGKLKKEKPLPEIADSEKPFDLPEGWEWCRISDIAKQYVDCPHSTPKYFDEGVICLRSQNIIPNKIDLSDLSYVSRSEYENRINRLKPAKNDVVYIREGGRLGIAGIIDVDEDVCLGQRLMMLRFFEGCTSIFISMLLNAPQTFEQIVSKTIGSAAPHVNVKDVIAHIIPLPPLAEQQAIVERVDNLLAMVDVLEKQVNERKVMAEELMQSVLKEALG